MTASAYILKAKTIANHLTTIGDPLLYGDLMVYFVGGLGSNSNYMSFVTSVNMNSQKPLLVSVLRDMLETYDCILANQGRLDSNKVYHTYHSNFLSK